MYLRVSPTLNLTVVAGTQAVDGSPIQDFVSVYGRRLTDLPSIEQLEAETRRLGARLAALRDAPQAERYNGPVLVEGQAADAVELRGVSPDVGERRLAQVSRGNRCADARQDIAVGCNGDHAARAAALHRLVVMAIAACVR